MPEGLVDNYFRFVKHPRLRREMLDLHHFNIKFTAGKGSLAKDVKPKLRGLRSTRDQATSAPDASH